MMRRTPVGRLQESQRVSDESGDEGPAVQRPLSTGRGQPPQYVTPDVAPVVEMDPATSSKTTGRDPRWFANDSQWQEMQKESPAGGQNRTPAGRRRNTPEGSGIRMKHTPEGVRPKTTRASRWRGVPRSPPRRSRRWVPVQTEESEDEYEEDQGRKSRRYAKKSAKQL